MCVCVWWMMWWSIGKGRVVVYMKSYKEKCRLFIQLKFTVSSSFLMIATFCETLPSWKWTACESVYKLHIFKPRPITKKTVYSVFLPCAALKQSFRWKNASFVPWGLLSSLTDVWLRLQTYTTVPVAGLSLEISLRSEWNINVWMIT